MAVLVCRKFNAHNFCRGFGITRYEIEGISNCVVKSLNRWKGRSVIQTKAPPSASAQ